jgi:hypothetical protein
MPAVKGLETGDTTVFFAAVREIDLMAQSGTPDLESIIRWFDFSMHSPHLIYIGEDVKVLPEGKGKEGQDWVRQCQISADR